MPKVLHDRLHSLSVRWSHDEPEPDPVLVASVLRIPGVRAVADGLDLPRSTWGLPEVCALVPQLSSEVPLGFVHAHPEGLYAHQKDAVDFLLRHEGGILADQMGLGKTRAAATAAHLLRQHVGRRNPPVLIVAPRYTRETWKRELAALGVLGAGFWAAEGTRPTEASKDYDADWWFCHYEILKAWAPVYAVNRRGRPIVAILDEAHWVRNARSKRGKAAQFVGGIAQRVYALTGTPLANRPSDLFALLTLVDGPRSWGHALDFRQRYCGASHSGFGWVDGQPTFVEEFQTRIAHRYLRRTINDAGITLPSLTRTAVYADLTDVEVAEQQAQLDSVFGGLAIEEVFDLLGSGGHLGKLVLEALHNLRVRTSAAKLGTTVDYVTSLLEQDEQVVVFVWQRDTAERLHRALGKVRPTGLIHGGQSQAQREALVELFQTGGLDAPAAIVSTIDALKEGVTLHRARHVVMHDLSWVPSDVLQAEARVYRIGQRRPATSAWVLARDSFDTLLARALLTKGAIQTTMLDYRDTELATQDFGLAGAMVASLEEEGARLLAQWRGQA